MKLVTISSAIASAIILAGCSRQHVAQPSPAALAAVHADMRLVGNETTWVTRGTGYELVGRSKVDLALFQPQLDRDADLMHRIFPGDTLTSVVATVRRAPAEGKPFIPAAPVPNEVHRVVVELVIPNPKAHAASDGRGGGGAEYNPTSPVIRAWLSAHATALTKQPAQVTQAEGESSDPRVPAWAETMIPELSADSLVDQLTTTLAAHPSDLIPLSQYFTMARPSFVAQSGQREGENRGGSGGSRGGGGYGGMGGGGRGGMGGGMGGRRGGMGGGMGRGGGESRSEESRPLQGGALFAAQSLVFGKYLVHQGYETIGALTDGQILGVAPDSTLAKRGMLSLQRMDMDWRDWLSERAASLNR